MEKGKSEYTPAENNLTAPCPNNGESGPKVANDDEPYLTSDEVRERLETINLKPGSRLRRRAQYHAHRAQIHPDDLLQAAMLTAMTSRKCRVNLGIEPFIMGIMRSKASKVIERRERKIQLGVGLHSLNQSAVEIPAPDVEAAQEQQQRAMICARLLAAISEGDPVVERVIDGQGQGYRGKELAECAGIGQDELATVRRRIKRRAAAIRKQLAALDYAA